MHQVTGYLKELFELESSGRKSKDAGTEERVKRIPKLRQLIPETVTGHYDRFVNAGKTPVAAVRNGVCQGCFVRLSSGAFQQLIRQDDLNLCENCGRYIYPDEARADEAPRPVAAKPKRSRRSQAVAQI